MNRCSSKPPCIQKYWKQYTWAVCLPADQLLVWIASPNVISKFPARLTGIPASQSQGPDLPGCLGKAKKASSCNQVLILLLFLWLWSPVNSTETMKSSLSTFLNELHLGSIPNRTIFRPKRNLRNRFSFSSSASRDSRLSSQRQTERGIYDSEVEFFSSLFITKSACSIIWNKRNDKDSFCKCHTPLLLLK